MIAQNYLVIHIVKNHFIIREQNYCLRLKTMMLMRVLMVIRVLMRMDHIHLQFQTMKELKMRLVDLILIGLMPEKN